MVGDWTARSEITSPRTLRALAWGDKMQAMANRATDETWDEAFLPMIDSERFVRRGNERDEELAWPEYRKLLEQWGEVSGRYDKTLYRASEVGNVVYLDLDERAEAKDGTVNTLRSLSLYHFDEADRIVAVDVIMGFHQPQPSPA